MMIAPAQAEHRWRGMATSRALWIIVVLLALTTLLHYFTPAARLLPPAIDDLSRHTVERIFFLLPVVVATFAFGRRAGAVTLIVITLIMLPRALWISPHRLDASFEILAIGIVGVLITWTTPRHRTISQLRAINAIMSIVTSSLKLEQVLKDTLDKVLDVTHTDAGLIFFLDEQSQELILSAWLGLSEESVKELERLQLGEGFCGHVAQSGELLVLEDSSRDPRLAKLAVRREGLRAQVIVPLRSKDQLQGVMAVATRQSRQFVPDDIEFITAIGNQIGVAMENAQLHQDVARELRVQQSLNEVAERITSELELKNILPKVLQIAEELTGADGGGIALVEGGSPLLRYAFLHNLPQELADLSIPKSAGAAGEVMTTGQPVIIEDYQIYPSAIPAFAEAGLTSVVAVPVVSGDQAFGTLTLVTLDKAKQFSQRDVTLLTGIARQTAVAIENARLYENLRFYIREITRTQENERRRIARELHDETIQMLIVLARRLEVLATLPEGLPATAMPYLASLQELIGETLKEMRRFIQDLRPPALDDLGLVAALKGLTADLMENDHIEAELKVRGQARRLEPEEIELVLFRIAQEALNNVRRHSHAQCTVVDVEFHPEKVRMTIEDNGCGFNAPERMGDLASSGKLGLIGMVERARTLGGTLDVHSKLGQGTVVVVDLPLHLEKQNEKA